jgi:hypothetical protein
MQVEDRVEDRVIGGLLLKPRKAAAAVLGKSEKTLVRWELDGSGPKVTRIGRDVYYAVPDLEKWVRSLSA